MRLRRIPSVTNSAQMSYADNWQAVTRSTLAGLPTAEQKDSSVFSLSCLKHCLTMGPGFWTNMIGNVSMASAASAWFYQGEPSKTLGQCVGYNRCVMC